MAANDNQPGLRFAAVRCEDGYVGFGLQPKCDFYYVDQKQAEDILGQLEAVVRRPKIRDTVSYVNTSGLGYNAGVGRDLSTHNL
jgi:hypothetical protein